MTAIPGQRRRPPGGLGFAFVLATLMLVSPFSRAGSADDELVALAKSSGKVLIADFGLGLCSQCKAQRAILDRIVASYGDKVIVRMVHVNKEQALTAKYGIEMIPHLVFFDGKGKVMLRKSGVVMSREEIVSQLSRMGISP